jgi:hypothetical protein
MNIFNLKLNKLFLSFEIFLINFISYDTLFFNKKIVKFKYKLL